MIKEKPQYEMTIDVQIRQLSNGGHGGLSIRETVLIMEIAEILMQFHALSKKLRESP